MLIQKIFSHTIYDQTTNGRFVNRPYEKTKVSDSIYDGGSKPPPYGVKKTADSVVASICRGRWHALA